MRLADLDRNPREGPKMTQQRCRSPIRGFLLTGAMLGLLAPVALKQEGGNYRKSHQRAW